MAGKGIGVRGGGVGIKLEGDWQKAADLLRIGGARLDECVQIALEAEAQALRSAMIRRLGMVQPPLSPFSRLKPGGKGGPRGKPLSGLRGHIAVVPSRGEIFIGISASNAKGVKLAAIHEFGRVVVQRMTDKQRRFLHAMLGKIASKVPGQAPSTGILVIHIPQRPFIRPAIAEQMPKMLGRFASRIISMMDGALGTKTGP